MTFPRWRAVVVVALFALSLAACGGTSGISAPPAGPLGPSNAGPGQGAARQTVVIPISRSGGTHALPLPAGYSGTISIGANNAPAGATMQIGVGIAGAADEASSRMILGSPSDPFPIVITISLPFQITLPVPAFTITFPSGVTLTQGTFDVAFFDPTRATNPPLNPDFLGKAVVSGQTLTFTPPPGETITFMPFVRYSLTISRDTGGTNVVLPVRANQANNLPMPPNGPLGGEITTTSNRTAFVQWTVIPFAPPGVANILGGGLGNLPVESLVVSGNQSLTLTNTTVTTSFSPTAKNSPVPGTSGTFVPDANPTILGPFNADVITHPGEATFTVPDALALGGGRAWDFSIITVTMCVPANPVPHIFAPCDSTNPSNALTTLRIGHEYNVLVSDSSGLLTGNYSVVVSGSTVDGNNTVPSPCKFVSESTPNGDVPAGYNDSWPQAPNTEFELFSGRSSPAACTMTVSYNGVAVGSINIGVGTTLPMTLVTRRPLTLRPPVNGPHGYVVSGGSL